MKENIPEAPSLLSIHPDRLGHATLLDPVSRETIYTRAIPVEICMTSNVLCKTVSSFEEHHVKGLLKEGHPFVLCVSTINQSITVFLNHIEIYAPLCRRTIRVCSFRISQMSTLYALRHSKCPENNCISRRIKLSMPSLPTIA